VEAGGSIRMICAERFLTDGQGVFVERLGLGVFAL